MAAVSTKKWYRIGVDVGGTNTDGVLLDPSRSSYEDKGIVAWHKSPTTTNPSVGISDAITAMFKTSKIQPESVSSVNIGTTHFVNAVVERDRSRLSPVAVIRLCGPFSKHSPPCVDWPKDISELILKHYVLLPGGLEVDGSVISDIDEGLIKEECEMIRKKGIRSVVVSGIFSPIDTIQKQEERAAKIIKAQIPGCDVVLSKDVANLGFVERENAAILNASILEFARKTIRSFQDPVRRLGLRCPVFITQNDGTILSGEMASKLPIRTFSSGPTNSMRGAAYLVGKEMDEAIMVVDIGGTTTDVGILLESGFPRQQAAYSDLAGVRMNFPCPDIKSIGLGGGSIVRKNGKYLTVGPDSVGYRLTKDALTFGGNVLTATDSAVLGAPDKVKIGNAQLIDGHLSASELEVCQKIIQQKIERVIDSMKTSPADIPVLLVGGGAVIAPDILQGASIVMKPRWSSVANAIGAAIARVSAVVDTVKSTESTTTSAILEKISQDAITKAVADGAIPSSVKIVEMETLPLQVRIATPSQTSRETSLTKDQYIANKSRFIVRAAGDFDYSRTETVSYVAEVEETTAEMNQYEKMPQQQKQEQESSTVDSESVDAETYVPTVKNRVWYINELDLNWIASGCYVLGTGGGGSPYSHMIRLRQMLRQGAIVRVVSPYDLSDDAQVGTGGGMGSPTVGIEKLPGDEMQEAQHELFKICDRPATHMIALEIGGGNGLQGMILGSSTIMDLPVVDGDWMGRAYPTKWQTTPVVFNERSPIWSPIAMCDGNGNVVLMPKATSDLQVERTLRAALSQMGSHVGCAEAPVSGSETKRWVVENTISQAWRIGRAIHRARTEKRIEDVAETIISECGGNSGAKVIWKGKIVGVERTLRMGHVYGECIIEGAEIVGGPEAHSLELSSEKPLRFAGHVRIPFKNENIGVIRISRGIDGIEKEQERQEDVLAIVPDLISVIDAQNGEAIGTPEYRYGLLVVVLGISASEKWTGTDRAVSIGGPEAFGFHHLSYRPLGNYLKPKSVIDEYDISE